ncbi:uncharacterized protein LOC131314147 [Rhododendron vialii]|uniref:uncharacterized protein LOC131314147 n=1 Tax=Rhododendron vialii TaxID=182163 RepID=UPI00265E8E4B|nr:uncharacterized protein LOC131314147 [Rhododendron vialii]
MVVDGIFVVEQSGKDISKGILAQRARRERERIFKQTTERFNLSETGILELMGETNMPYMFPRYLSTCKKSKLYVNHSIRTDGIPEWFAKDENAQKSVTWNRTHGFSLPQALIISNARRIRINQFAFRTNVNYYRFIGRIEKIYVEHLWIDLCNTCYNQVDNQYGWFMCKHCGREDVQTVTRYNAKMVVKDSTGSMELFVKDTKAEFILQCVPSYLKKLMLKDNGAQMLKDYISQFNECPYVFIIPAPKFGCVDHCAPVVTFVLKVDWSEECWHIFKGKSRTGKETLDSS